MVPGDEELVVELVLPDVVVAGAVVVTPVLPADEIEK